MSTLCFQKFETVQGQVITLNILEMEIEEEAEGWIDVFDSKDQYGEKIAHYPLTNGTLPQGITSSYIYMYVSLWLEATTKGMSTAVGLHKVYHAG